MAKAKDFTGRRFGRLVVTGLDPTPYRTPGGKSVRRWVCRCDCGNTVSVLQSALSKKDGTRSCGCARRDSMRAFGHDLTGKRFGRLTVIRSVDLEKPTPNGNRQGWLCRCDCGKEIVSTQKLLESGEKRSCGCLLSDTARSKINDKNVVGHFDGTTVSAIRPNRKMNKNNTSGVKGVYWSNREQCWIASICVRRKSIKIGRYSSLEDARKARLDAEKTYFNPIIEAYDNLPPD